MLESKAVMMPQQFISCCFYGMAIAVILSLYKKMKYSTTDSLGKSMVISLSLQYAVTYSIINSQYV